MTSNQHIQLSEGSTFLNYLIEVAAGYCWSTVPFSVLFGKSLQESPHGELSPSATRRVCSYAIVPKRMDDLTSVNYRKVAS